MPNGTLDPQPIPVVLGYDCRYYCSLSHKYEFGSSAACSLVSKLRANQRVNKGHRAAWDSESLLSLGKLLGGSVS